MGYGPVHAIALTGSDQVVRNAPCIYHGIAVRETAGAVAVVDVYDNASTNSGTRLDPISLGPNESITIWRECGVRAQNGVFVDIVSGTVVGSVDVS